MKPGTEPDYPVQETLIIDGEVYHRRDYHPDYFDIGIIPIPRTRWRVFLYHFCHGILMQYPLWDVLLFSLRYCDPTEHWRDWDGRDVEIIEEDEIEQAVNA